MNLKKSSLAVAVTGAIALAVAGQASASVYGGSKLDLQNLQIFITQDGVNPSPNAPITSFEFTATNTATLNGVSSPVQSATCGGTPGLPGVTNNCNAALPRLDPTAANAPGGTINRANNDFSLFGPGLNQYANSDSVLQQAELTFDGPTQTHQIAETELQTGASARANAEITSNTGFTFAFTLAAPGELVLSFEADPYLRAVINQGSNFVNGNAQANINFTVSLTNNNTGDSITWSPQGTAAFNDCSVDGGLVGVACSETADGQDLNRNLSVTSNPSDVQHSTAVGFSAFGIDITGLTAGAYTFALNAVTSTSVRQTVPEPATLALLGVGLIGIGAAKRRDSKRA